MVHFLTFKELTGMAGAGVNQQMGILAALDTPSTAAVRETTVPCDSEMSTLKAVHATTLRSNLA